MCEPLNENRDRVFAWSNSRCPMARMDRDKHARDVLVAMHPDVNRPGSSAKTSPPCALVCKPRLKFTATPFGTREQRTAGDRMPLSIAPTASLLQAASHLEPLAAVKYSPGPPCWAAEKTRPPRLQAGACAFSAPAHHICHSHSSQFAVGCPPPGKLLSS